MVCTWLEVVGPLVDEAGVVEDRETDGAYDIERVFRTEEAVGLATDWLAKFVARADLAKLETAQRCRAAEVPLVVVRHVARGAEIFNHAEAAEEREHLRLGFKHREELGAAKLEAVVVVDVTPAQQAARV